MEVAVLFFFLNVDPNKVQEYQKAHSGEAQDGSHRHWCEAYRDFKGRKPDQVGQEVDQKQRGEADDCVDQQLPGEIVDDYREHYRAYSEEEKADEDAGFEGHFEIRAYRQVLGVI